MAKVELCTGLTNSGKACDVLRLTGSWPATPEGVGELTAAAQEKGRQLIDNGHYWGDETNLVVLESEAEAPAAAGAMLAAAVAASEENPRSALASATAGEGQAVVLNGDEAGGLIRYDRAAEIPNRSVFDEDEG